MKKLFPHVLALASALSVAGCNTPQGQNAAGGAVVGGATGALIGAATTGRASGALVGGAIGAAGGAVLGSALTPNDPGYVPRCAEYYYDYYGHPVCRSYY